MAHPENELAHELAFDELREAMVRYQIEQRGISDVRVLDAMREVPRHLFVPPHIRASAYDDTPLPIGYGQTISQPYIVALMTELLEPRPDDVVLEIGTGSGYQAAVLSRIVSKVYTVERIPELLEGARRVWRKLGYDNIEGFLGNGWNGLPQFAPYDGIIVTAAASRVPEPLLEQLKTGAHLVIPVGELYQRLWRITKTQDGFVEQPSISVRFVPLLEE